MLVAELVLLTVIKMDKQLDGLMDSQLVSMMVHNLVDVRADLKDVRLVERLVAVVLVLMKVLTMVEVWDTCSVLTMVVKRVGCLGLSMVD